NRASFRVLRGGSFNDRPSFARSAVRYRYSPENRYRYVGLRCVRGPSPQH
ncbi:MAG: SUMF1/EgtB/PvdO family nonheme iron enzyme, partial [Nannocystaceae bacterium]